MWIGIDDTDSKRGMCTTYLVGDILKELWNYGLELLRYPRLIRLNPNIPWKTRGNGAVALEVGVPHKKLEKIGWMGQKIYRCTAKSVSIDVEAVTEGLRNVIQHHAELDAEGTNPGLVVTQKKPPYGVYDKTVKEIVTLKETRDILDIVGAYYFGFKNERGLIGATAAVAWRPYTDKTYELLVYGKKAQLSKENVIKMDYCCPSTFDNYDYENRHVQIMPHAPGPVIYGVRGDNEKELKKAMRMLRVPGVQRWFLFETNQGTDDHLQKKKIEDIHPYQSVIVTGQVASAPRTITGGHLIFSLMGTKTIDCACYEPTKNFRTVIRNLYPGDKITVYGGIRTNPLTVNIEKILIHELVAIHRKVENPVCPRCKRHMKSMGKNDGYRCRRCGIKSGNEKATTVTIKRNLSSIFYEVPVVARRHLAKPLKRMQNII